MSENWKQIPGYPEYLVSDNGRICSLKSGLLKPCENSRGYMLVNLSGDTKRLHRIVASAYLPNPEGKEQVNHIDGNTKNNSVSNLEWVSNSENQIHRVSVLNRNTNKRIVEKVDKTGNVIAEFPSVAECERAEKFTQYCLRDYIRHNRCIKGFYYRYKEVEKCKL